MTVCIAAVCCTDTKADMDNTAIVLVNDWQETDSVTDMTAQRAWKATQITRRIAAMGAGDIVLFRDLINRVCLRIQAEKVEGTITTQQVADLYSVFEQEHRYKCIEKHVLSKWGLSFERFYEKQALGELSQEFLDVLGRSITTYQKPYGTEVIIAGVEDTTGARIFKITEDSPPEDYTSEGYAVIGLGRDTVKAELNRFYNWTMPLSEVAAACILAKRRCEELSSVGDETGLWIIDRDSGFDSINFEIRIQIERDSARLNERRVKNDIKFCKASQRLFAKFPTTTRKAKKRADYGS